MALVAPNSPFVFERTLESELDRLVERYDLPYEAAFVKELIRCESSLHAHATGTQAVVGKDIGWMQINTYYHLSDSKKMGLDIYNKWDNLEYGFYLMSKRGLSPWSASKHCWSKYL
jgi:hypothetical protein